MGSVLFWVKIGWLWNLKKGREQYSVCCYCEWYEGISLRSSSWLQHRKEKSDRKMPTDPRPSSDMKRCSWNGYLKVISRKPHLFHNIIWYKNTYTDPPDDLELKCLGSSLGKGLSLKYRVLGK